MQKVVLNRHQIDGIRSYSTHYGGEFYELNSSEQCIAFGMHTSGNNTYTHKCTYNTNCRNVWLESETRTLAGSIIIYNTRCQNRREYKLIDTSQQIKYNLATNHLEQWAAINQSVCDSAQCIWKDTIGFLVYTRPFNNINKCPHISTV